MSNSELPEEFVRLLQAVKGKRSRIVVEHILSHGYITTEDLETIYGYKHPPRAIRDVREQGVPLETFQAKDNQGRTIAAYRFAMDENIRQGRIGGRKPVIKAVKKRLVEQSQHTCAICLNQFDERFLQVDHRIPYEVAGEPEEANSLGNFMLLCGSCNRAKSWSCEHCTNWHEIKKPDLCKSCYWASQQSYTHIALRPIRRLDIIWSEEEIEVYEQIKAQAIFQDQSLPDYVKEILQKHLNNRE